FARDADALAPLVARLKDAGCRVSLFADAGSELAPAAGSGADRVDLYPGPYAGAFAAGRAGDVLPAFAATATAAQAAGLAVNAGHDLSQANLGAFLDAVPGVEEVSIGHALIGEALYEGLATTIARYLAILSPPQTKRRPTAAVATCGGKRPARCRRRRTVELYFLTNPIFCMWAFLAAASTLASTPYSASSLMSISSVGWLLMSRWTSASIIWRRADNGVGLSFQ